MGNRSTRQQHQIEELEMSLAMTTSELMEMSAKINMINIRGVPLKDERQRTPPNDNKRPEYGHYDVDCCPCGGN